MPAAWEVLVLSEVSAWYMDLDSATSSRVETAIDLLEAGGPSLGRPLVDQIKGSRHPNMKALRTGSIRILFVFDPSRQAILLVGGDKRGAWTSWYQTAIPLADDRYDNWLKEQTR